MNIEGKGLDRIIEGKLSKYRFAVGILENKQHYAPREILIGKKNGKPFYKKEWYYYAGLNLLKHGNEVDGTLYSIAKELDQEYKWLRKPFMLQSNEDVINVLNFIVENMNGKDNLQRIVNAVQAVVRNPILRGSYGRNSARTAKKKGFNKLLMSTGQFFKNIKARLR